MKFRIGFSSETHDEISKEVASPDQSRIIAPRKSVVLVRFPGHSCSLAYFNDQFDLHLGDFVYVDGKLEGQLGRVVDVNYNFKIKISDYKRVITLVDTNVKGQLFYAGTHFITFDRATLSPAQVSTWFKAPSKEEDQYVSGSDDSSFHLENLQDMKVSPVVASRGYDYHMEGKVVYVSIDGSNGYAIVKGSKYYEVDFEYRNGEISHLTCSCFCSNNCKHEFAAMRQLRETLELIEKHYSSHYEETGYFAALRMELLFEYAIGCKETGSITIE